MLNVAGEAKVSFVEYKENAESPSKSYTKISCFKAIRSKGLDETQLFKFRIMVFGKNAQQAGTIQKGEIVFFVGELRPEFYKDKEGVVKESLTVYADKVDSFSYRESAGKPKKAADDFPFPMPEGAVKSATIPDDDIPF